MTAYRLPRDVSDYPPNTPLVASTSGFFSTPAWHGWVAAFVIAGLAVAFILLRILAAIKHHLHLPTDNTRPPLTRHQQRALAPQTFSQRIKCRLKRMVPQPLRSHLFPASASSAPTAVPAGHIGNAGNANGQRQVGQGDIRSNESFLPAYSAPPSYTTEPTPVRFWMSNRFRRLFTNPLHRFSRQHTIANAGLDANAGADAEANANMNININHDLERLERQTVELVPSQTTTMLLTSSLPQLIATPPRSQVIQPEIGPSNAVSRTTARRSSITWAAISSVPPEPPPHYSYPNLPNPSNPSDSNQSVVQVNHSSHPSHPNPPSQSTQSTQPNRSNQSDGLTHSTSQIQEVEMAEMATTPSTANPTS